MKYTTLKKAQITSGIEQSELFLINIDFGK